MFSCMNCVIPGSLKNRWSNFVPQPFFLGFLILKLVFFQKATLLFACFTASQIFVCFLFFSNAFKKETHFLKFT